MNLLSQQRWFIVLPAHGAARAVGEEILPAFSQYLGAPCVKGFDCKTYLEAFNSLLKNPSEALVTDLLNHAMIVQCLDFKATNILVLALCPVTLFALNLLRRQHVQTSHWFYEDFRVAHYWKEVLAGYDFFFAIQKGILIEECRRKQSAFVFLPTASTRDSGGEYPRKSSFQADVAFIGFPSAYRIGFLEFFASKGIRLSIAGAGWKSYHGILDQFIKNREWTNDRETAEILSNSFIGINLSLNDPEDDRDNTHVSPRVFDIAKAGCILITEDVPLARRILDECTYYVFKNKEQALEIVKDEIVNPKTTPDMLRKNREIILAGHTYENRVKEIVRLTQSKRDGP